MVLAACGRTKSSSGDAPSAPPPPEGGRSATSPVEPATARAEVGKPAPDFALKDVRGQELRLSSFKGKRVVLEWFNPQCPYVKAAHTKGSLKDAAKRHTRDGVIWLAVNSAAPGKQGHGASVNAEGAKTFGLEHPVLIDETGNVGRTYGATNTPHVMVIDESGTLVYRGAVDNSPDGEGESPTSGTLIRYVDNALASLTERKPVQPAETKAYGCSVKY